MGPKIVIPIIVLGVVIPLAFMWAKKRFKEQAGNDSAAQLAPSARLTSNALRNLPSPPWRVVYEISPTLLSGVEHVLIGHSGIYGITTSLGPLPQPSTAEPDASTLGEQAVVRGDLDDALRGGGLSCDRLLHLHWTSPDTPQPVSVDVVPGTIAVDGHRLREYLAAQPSNRLTESQIDLGWQSVLVSIGRPDPLA